MFDPAPLSWDVCQGLDCFSPACGRKWALCPGSFCSCQSKIGAEPMAVGTGRVIFCESCWYLLEKGEMLQAQEERRNQV